MNAVDRLGRAGPPAPQVEHEAGVAERLLAEGGRIGAGALEERFDIGEELILERLHGEADASRTYPTVSSVQILLDGAYCRRDLACVENPPNLLDPVRRLVLEIGAGVEGGLKEMSLAVGKSHSYFQQFVTRGSPRLLPEEVRDRLARLYGVPADQFKTGAPAGQKRPPPRRAANAGEIVEVDARAGAGLGAGGELLNVSENGRDIISQEAPVALWRLPPEYLRFELRVAEQAVRLVEVIGDSMAPTLMSGDRIMVNTGDRRPSPPGVFALWDGLGVVVKRVEHIPQTDPAILRITSDNPHHASYERTVDEVQLIGRVVWYGRRL